MFAKDSPVIAVVLPCYRTAKHVLGVINSIGSEVKHIFAVDDKCPERTGDLIERECNDPRVRVLRHEVNRGVGGAVKTGYLAALEAGCDIIVKVDSDGQMDPLLIPGLIAPLASGVSDYVKGNRFFYPEYVRTMPLLRWLGNIGLSFLTKLSSGYWSVFDPCNGFTAIHRTALLRLPLDKVADRYFFETDMLFRLNLIGAVVAEYPARAKYADETSGMSLKKIFVEFTWRHVGTFAKRVYYKYFLRDFSYGSLCLLAGLPLTIWGLLFGAYSWWHSAQASIFSSPGTVMLSALPLLMGLQFLMSFMAADQQSQPKIALQFLYGTPGKAIVHLERK